MNAKPASKREVQKQVRRDAIIGAAESLIRERGDIGFSMLDLAQKAEVSPATPYNLFGTKSAILYALLNRSADRMFDAAEPPRGSDPVKRALGAARALAEVLASDPNFYRPLYSFLMGVPDDRSRPGFIARARAYWAAPFEQPSDQAAWPVDSRIMGDLLIVQALGCVEMWVHRDLDGAGLAVELHRSCSAALLGLAAADHQTMLLEYVLAPRSFDIGARTLSPPTATHAG